MKIEEGKELAEYLQNSVNLPVVGLPKYKERIIGAMNFEYKLLKNYFGEKNG